MESQGIDPYFEYHRHVILDFLKCIALKIGYNLSVVEQVVIFLRHLLSISEGSHQPIVIF